MKRIPLLVTMACLLTATLCRAHVPGARLYYIYEFLDQDLPDLHDGTLDDWEGVLSRPTFTEFSFGPLEVGDGASMGPPDLAVNVYLGWSGTQNRLYAAIERLDDVYVNTYEGGDLSNVWRHDSVEIMVDGDHSGGWYSGFHENPCEGFKRVAQLADYWDPCRYFSGFQAQQYIGIASAPDGRLLGRQSSNPDDWETGLPYGDAGGFVEEGTPHRSVVEIMVTPFDELRWDTPEHSRESTLKVGRIIGLQVSIPDFDEEAGAYHGFSTLQGQPNTWRQADNFVDCVLMGSDRDFFTDADVILEDFRFSEENGDGVLDAGEAGQLVFDPRPDLELPTGGVHVRLQSGDPHLRLLRSEGFTSASSPFEPLSYTWEAASAGVGDVGLVLELEQEGQRRGWPMWLATRSPRLPRPRLEVVDALPEGRGNGDAMAQPGEIVQLVLVLDTGDARVVEGTEVELRSLGGRLSLLEKGEMRFRVVDGEIQEATVGQYLVNSGCQAGDSLGLALATRRQYATWVETLYVPVGEGGDRVAPVITGEVQIWHGEEGLHLLYPESDFIEGSDVETVEFVLSGPGGGSAPLRFPLQKQLGHWEAMLSPPGSGEYAYVLAATDAAGNESQTQLLPLVVEDIARPGRIHVIVGRGERTGASLGTYRKVLEPVGLAVDRQDRLYIVDAGLHQLLRWNRTGLVEVIAGAVPPSAGNEGDDGPASGALLNRPSGVALDGAGRIYIADSGNHRIRCIDLSGSITTIAGSDSGFAGDGGSALDARFSTPQGLCFDRSGNLYVADSGNHRVRRIDAQGVVATVAGSGAAEYGGDGGPALLAGMVRPVAVAADGQGRLFIADAGDGRVRLVTGDGTIATFAGIGDQRSSAGDGDLATEVRIDRPGALLLDGGGNLLIADRYRVRRIDGQGIITTVTAGKVGVYAPAGMAGDGRGNLYVGDTFAQRVVAMVGGVEPVVPVPTVAEERPLPADPVLLPNYPNPLNRGTVIRYALPTSGEVELVVFNLAGQQVATLVDGLLDAGMYSVRWDGRDGDGRDLASGVYLYQLRVGDGQQVETRKLVLMK